MSTQEGNAAKVRPATDKWGCAYQRCLNAARVVVKGSDGSEWGACATHIKAVQRAAK